MTDDELQDAAVHIADQFADHDRRFLALMTPQERAGHEQALWMLYHHVDRIWEAPKKAGGPHPVNLGGYGAVAGLRDLLAALIGHVEEVSAQAGDQPEDWRARMVVERND
ncbi:hypothetical protein AB0F83_26235 [Micromonospora chalcea]|uniref:hypothetical protein n=1 Tax=Micromonospora chalcea TaxID=1874 RepID=UPI0033CC6576